MTTTILIETLATIKNVKPSEIKNLDTYSCTFELGKSIYSFEMTPSGKYVKSNSVKFFATISNFQNASY